MKQYTFLIEIGTEELPIKSLKNLSKNFSTQLSKELIKQKFNYNKINNYITPRRLAVKVNDLKKIINKKNQNINKLFLKKKKEKPKIKEIIYNIIKKLITKLNFLKKMNWGDKKEKFIRPIHTITILLNKKLIKGNIFGIKINRILYGHRFMGKKKIYLENAKHYPEILSILGKVIANYKKRKKYILNNIKSTARKINGIIDLDKDLIKETTSSVEWPIIHFAKFKKYFLKIPIEILLYIIKICQKYFPIYNLYKKLLSYFIFISNMESKKNKNIIIGNEKVLYPRFLDVNFFINKDLKKPLIEYLEKLKNISFYKNLGTLFNKTNRIKIISCWISNKIGIKKKYIERASLLSKCDLATTMVFEFNDMKGIIGMYYSHYNGESKNIALTQKEHYLPKFSNDVITTTIISSIIAIADKIDTLVGILSIKNYSKKDNDPFGLRRITIGIIRIIIEKNLKLNLKKLIKKSIEQYYNKIYNKKLEKIVNNFIINKLKFWYIKKNYKLNIIESVLSKQSIKSLININKLIKALKYFLTLKKSNKLLIINKRILNILKISKINIKNNFKVSLFKNISEIKLASYLLITKQKIKSLIINSIYINILIELTKLYKPINIFFKNNKIITNNLKLSTNRVTLLNEFKNLFSKIIDISLLY